MNDGFNRMNFFFKSAWILYFFTINPLNRTKILTFLYNNTKIFRIYSCTNTILSL